MIAQTAPVSLPRNALFDPSEAAFIAARSQRIHDGGESLADALRTPWPRLLRDLMSSACTASRWNRRAAPAGFPQRRTIKSKIGAILPYGAPKCPARPRPLPPVTFPFRPQVFL